MTYDPFVPDKTVVAAGHRARMKLLEALDVEHLIEHPNSRVVVVLPVREMDPPLVDINLTPASAIGLAERLTTYRGMLSDPVIAARIKDLNDG